MNVKTLWSSLGELIVAPAFYGPLGRVPGCAGATIALVGVAMLARRRIFTHEHAFALGFLALLAVWHYPSTPRFALPCLPLLLVGRPAAALEAWRMVAERHRVARRVVA